MCRYIEKEKGIHALQDFILWALNSEVNIIIAVPDWSPSLCHFRMQSHHSTSAMPKGKSPNPGVFVSNAYLWPWQTKKRCMSAWSSTIKTVRHHLRGCQLVLPATSSSVSRSPWCCYWTDWAARCRVMTRWCVKKVCHAQVRLWIKLSECMPAEDGGMFESWHCLEQLASSLWDIGLWCVCVYWCVSVPLNNRVQQHGGFFHFTIYTLGLLLGR